MSMRLLSLLFIFFLLSNPVVGNNVDSLLTILEEQTLLGLDKIYEIHYDLGEEYRSRKKENYKLSEHHYSIALNLIQKTADNEKIADCLYGIGYTHQRRNNYQEALVSFNKILELKEEGDNNFKRPKAYTQISTIYQALGDYQRAFENQMKALLIYEMKKDLLGIANSNYNIGTIFYYQNQYEKSLEFYLKAKTIVDDLKNEKFNYSCSAALGSVYEKLENNEESLKYNMLSLELAKKQKYKTGIAYSEGNIAMNYLTQGDFSKAEKYLKESITLKHELGDRYGTIGTGIDLSQLYILWEKPKKAIPILEKALVLAHEVESKNRQSDIYKSFSAVYDQLNQPVISHAYIKKYVALKDSLLNEKTLEEMGQSQKRYEVQMREHEIEILKRENQLLGKNKEIQQLQIYIGIIIIVSFLLFGWWIKNRLKLQQKTNQLLADKNEEINVQNLELQNAKNQLINANYLLEENNLLQEKNNNLLADKNDEIKVKNKQLEHSNEDLQQFAYVASHDLKEPLRMINSYTKLLERRYNSLFDDTGKEFMYFVTDAVKRMEVLLDDLLDFSRAGTQEAPKDTISIEMVMLLVEANLRHRFELLNAKMIVKSENFPAVKVHRTQLLQLLQNLVSNGVKFKGDRDPIVIVDCKKRENDYVISVKDNGIGISEENKKKVFEMFKRLHTRDEYEGTGIGLATCKRIVSSWGGDIWVESELGHGCTFFFSIPSFIVEEKTQKLPSSMLN
jgi:signal transduction histidine kinase/Flp pilus assembly protein TadD